MWVEWNEEDQVYLGYCPDLMTPIHHEDPVQLYAELRELVAEIIEDFESAGESLPAPVTRPARDEESNPESPFDRERSAHSEAA